MVAEGAGGGGKSLPTLTAHVLALNLVLAPSRRSHAAVSVSAASTMMNGRRTPPQSHPRAASCRSTSRFAVRRTPAIEVRPPGATERSRRVSIYGMGTVVAASTLWGLFTMSFLLPAVGAPGGLRRTADALLAGELVALLAWSYAHDGCGSSGCGMGVSLLHDAGHEDIPALALALLVVTLLYGYRSHRGGSE
jgi:hypothetical protein